MKKLYFAFIASILMLTSCDKTETASCDVSSNIITASFENKNSSRVAVEDNNLLSWSTGDSFVMFSESGAGYYTLSGEGGSSTGTFTGTLPSGTIKGAAFPFVGISNPTLSGNTLTMNLPTEINFEEKICNSPMWANITSSVIESISFKHLVSMLKVDLSGIPATAGQLIVDASSAIAGEFTSDITNTGEDLILVAASGATNSITVNFTPSSANQRMFLIPIPVGTYTNLSLSYANADGSGKTFLKSWNNLTFTRAIPNKATIEIGNIVADLNSDVEVDGDTYKIKTIGGLFWFADQVNNGTTFQGKTVQLINDINLNNVLWTPIGGDSKTKQFKGTFDGCDHTISNLKIEGGETEMVGLFGYIEHDATTIRNLNIENVDISGAQYVAAIAGYAVGAKIINCVVDGGSIKAVPYLEGSLYKRGGRAAGITGYTGRNTATANVDHNSNIVDCEVKNLQISAYYNIGGVVAYARNAKITFTGNKVTSCVLIADQSSSPYDGTKNHDVDYLIGDFDATLDSSNEYTNVVINKVGL